MKKKDAGACFSEQLFSDIAKACNDAAFAKILENVKNSDAAVGKKLATLHSENIDLRRSILKHETGKLKILKCQNCRNHYLAKNNTEEACVYHPGRLKFFSCRGCGADQYYSCCNMCTCCSPGCRHAKHVS